jgi:dTMP kinase
MTKRSRRARGLLIAFEGEDGSGKTTQRRLLKDWLVGRNHSVVVTKWNSSPRFKPIIKAKKAERSLAPEEFARLHALDFRDRYESEILPALGNGATVIADRYVFTGLARDVARGLDREWSMRLYEPLVWPDLVFYLSAPPDVCSSRIAASRVPKYYEAGQDVTGVSDPFESYHRFIQQVIAEYERLSESFPFVVVDASQPIYEQHRFIRTICEEWINIAAVLELTEPVSIMHSSVFAAR